MGVDVCLIGTTFRLCGGGGVFSWLRGFGGRLAVFLIVLQIAYFTLLLLSAFEIKLRIAAVSLIFMALALIVRWGRRGK